MKIRLRELATAASVVVLVAACGADGMGAAEYATYYPGTEKFSEWEENQFIDASQQDTSTFSVDVDKASYTVMRSSIDAGELPPPDSVRPEEYINYFDYDYPEPDGEHPFSINLEAAPSRFGAAPDDEHEMNRRLLRVGLRGKHVDISEMRETNLIFLVDTSGSMKGEKIKMVQHGLRTLVDHLRPEDTVGIVTYAGSDKTLLEPTAIGSKRQVNNGIDKLRRTGGSTNASAGIVTAYELLERVADDGGNNRVIILTDGDFNVGMMGDELIDYVSTYRDRHMSLTAVGVGRGNLNDYTMEGLAQNANGNYFYFDSDAEAERVFGRDLVRNIEVIAADVKIQVEFNEDVVGRYRLIGYENRVLANEDFDDDTKDAGEIGPDHRVTAFYELELLEDVPDDELLAEVRLRYKSQYGDESTEFGQDLKVANLRSSFAEASDDFRFGAAVAEYAEILRNSQYSEGRRFDEVGEIAANAGDSTRGDVMEFLQLIYAARNM